MKLLSSGREFLKLGTSDTSAGGVLEVSFDDATTWHPLEEVDATHARVLVAGPDAESNPVDTVVLPIGSYEVLVRWTIDQEATIREAPDHLHITTD